MIDLPIKDSKLKSLALTHRSYLNEHRSVSEHNERLEYLGDAVLELAVTKFLFDKYPKKPEGELTALRSAMVRTTTLSTVAATLDLGKKLKMSKGEAVSGGRENLALLANTFEAVVGSIYLDQGFESVVEFLEIHLFPLLPEIIEKGLEKDFKSTLQEMVQAEGKPTPTYVVVSESGPDHDKEFKVTVKVGQDELASGEGKSKQLAQQAAAEAALRK